MERIIAEVGREQDDTLKEYYGILIKLILEKNPRFIEIVRRDSAMEDVLMEIVKDRVDAERQETPMQDWSKRKCNPFQYRTYSLKK